MQMIQTEPTFTVPFQRDSRFVGRTDVIAELHQKLASSRRVALVGIGGVGYGIALPHARSR